MIKHDLNIDENNIFRIELGYLGKERYFLNDKLIHEKIGLCLSGERLFDIDINNKKKKLKIACSTHIWNINKVLAKAYLDDILIEDDIFRDYRKKWRKYNIAANAVLIISIIFMIITMYMYYFL